MNGRDKNPYETMHVFRTLSNIYDETFCVTVAKNSITYVLQAPIYGTECSRIDEVKFVKDSL